jgi:hypothetical protein
MPTMWIGTGLGMALVVDHAQEALCDLVVGAPWGGVVCVM